MKRRKRKAKLNVSMTPADFDHGYWYAGELKEFAKSVGVRSPAGLRKDELETVLRRFLRTGRLPSSAPERRARIGKRDIERGLRLDLLVRVYTNDQETKAFLEGEARKMFPAFRRKSGARYRLNRWREERCRAGSPITYRDLVREYVRLNRTEGRFPQIPHGRYINFVSDFMAARPGSGMKQAIAAWAEVKAMVGPKNYRFWARSKR